MFLFALASCRELENNLPTVVTIQKHAQLRQSTAENFRHAVFYKPAGGYDDRTAFSLAPLIVQELPERGIGEGGVQDDRFGAVQGIAEGKLAVAVESPTVYVATGEVRIGDTSYPQITYAWFYSNASKLAQQKMFSENSSHKRPTDFLRQTQGIHMTLGSDGFPIAVESLSDGNDVRLIFVSQSAEQLAKSQFGEPPQGRNFSIERPLLEAENVVVVKTIEDGPIPMGPYFYLRAGSRNAMTVLCRCSPAQVDQFDEEKHYELRSADELPPELSRLLAPPNDLEKRLRWPSGL